MVFKYTDRLKHSLSAGVVITLLFTSGCSEQLLKTEPTLQDVLDAPAADLALGYLSVKHTVRLVALGERANVIIGNTKINKDNVEEYKAKYGERLALYEQAIRQRGFEAVAGHYKGEATEACVRSNAMWAALIQRQSQKAIEITQEGMDAQVIISVEYEGQERRLKNSAAIAESAMALNEMSNSDYYFRGEIRDNIIVFKPDLSVLRTWPKWANPPRREDLEDCVITLERLADSGQKT